MKNVSVLGSTGSIGRSSLEVVEAFPDRYRVVALAAGRSVEKLAEQAIRHGPEIVPVDSEHCAIHQAMRGGARTEVERLVLTASGGPFRRRNLATFEAITVEDALAHPTWKMGPKITIDSATMMNKGLEIIEAHF